SGIFPWFW
ncbi:ABC transporter, partial [Calderihabitans maritimus]